MNKYAVSKSLWLFKTNSDMYVTLKDLETISELSAFVDGALESADGLDENGKNISEYWLDLDKRVEKLQSKMKKQYSRQKSYNEID